MLTPPSLNQKLSADSHARRGAHLVLPVRCALRLRCGGARAGLHCLELAVPCLRPRDNLGWTDRAHMRSMQSKHCSELPQLMQAKHTE